MKAEVGCSEHLLRTFKQTDRFFTSQLGADFRLSST